MRTFGCVLMLACAASIAARAAPSSAQSATANTVTSTANEQATGTMLKEVIVTAQKRPENLQDVPIAVSVVQGSQLVATGIESVTDLKVVVPALNTASPNGYFTSTLRGVGSASFGVGVESPVAVYVDGVYLAGPVASELLLNNISSVEVLKGPQGTLFGRNATGGLIQVTTDTPTQEDHGHIDLSYGNYGIFNGAAYISGGIARDLAADLAVTGITQEDGFGRDSTTGVDTYRTNQDGNIRSKWVWSPSGTGTKVTLIGDYYNDIDSQSNPSQFPGKVSASTGLVGPDLGYNSVNDRNTLSKIHGGGGSLRLDQDVGWAQLSSITAYQQSLYYFSDDLDFTPLNLQYLSLIQRTKQFSEELQASSKTGERLQWTGGLYYFADAGTYDPVYINDYDGAVQITELDTEKVHSPAAYAQATYQIADGTRLTLGGRYTAEWRQEASPSENLLFAPSPPLLVTLPNRSIRIDKFTYRASIDHRLSDTMLAYVSYNTGFKSGGFNADSPGSAPYKPETLNATEIGLKSEFLDHRVRLNLASFYYNYKDIQVEKIVVNTINVINGAAARIYGVDADGAFLVSQGLSVRMGLEWLSPTFTSFPGCPIGSEIGGVPQVSGDCAGKQLPFASKVTANAAATYSGALAGGVVSATGALYYNSGEAFEPDNVLSQGSFVKLNASVKWEASSGLSIGVFGKNLTNRRVIAEASTEGGGGQSLVYEAPRTYGLTLGYQF